MTDERDTIIYLDIDGVMVDFVGEAVKLFCPVGWAHILQTWPKGEHNVWDVLGITIDKFWSEIDAEGSEFWRQLQPYAWAMPLYNRLNSLGKVILLTSPSKDSDSAKGKIQWMQSFFREGRDFRDYMVVPSGLKQQLAADGRFLVDDNERNVKQFNDAGGSAILVPQPWNSGEYVDDVADYVDNAIRRCKEERA